jgi:hypothetical protein
MSIKSLQLIRRQRGRFGFLLLDRLYCMQTSFIWRARNFGVGRSLHRRRYTTDGWPRAFCNAYSVTDMIGAITQGRPFAELRTNPGLRYVTALR